MPSETAWKIGQYLGDYYNGGTKDVLRDAVDAVAELGEVINVIHEAYSNFVLWVKEVFEKSDFWAKSI